MGFQLLDSHGAELGPGGGELGRLARIDRPHQGVQPLGPVTVSVACDVNNPLCGPDGATAVYGPQKGATPKVVEQLERKLDHFAQIVARDLHVAIRDVPGAGAAGGLGGGLMAFAGGRLERGIDLVIDAVNLRRRLQPADLCITGEGALDGQSAFGKTVVGVAREARDLGCPALALAGTIGTGAAAVLELGVNAYFSICPAPITLEEAVRRAAELLEETTAQALRAFLAGRIGR
jgi:glycerate kinase